MAGFVAALIGRLAVAGRLGSGDRAAAFMLSFLLGVVLVFTYAASLVGNFSGRGLAIAQAFPV